MNECLLLLKYRIRDCYFSEEKEIDNNTYYQCLEPWETYQEPDHRMWYLLPPGKEGFRSEAERTRCSYKFEFLAAGDPNPVIAYFTCQMYMNDHEIEIIRLPENYQTTEFRVGSNEMFKETVRPILCEYERYRTEWQTRIIVEGDVE